MCYAEQWSKELFLNITLHRNLQLQALYPCWHSEVIFQAPESLLHSRWTHHPQGELHWSFHSVHLCRGTWSHLAVAASQGDVNLSTHRPVLLTARPGFAAQTPRPPQSQPSSWYRNAHGHLLVMPSHSATHMPWFLSNSEARSSHSCILSVWQQEWGTELFSCTLIMALIAKKGEPALQLGSAGHAGCGSEAHLGLPTSKGLEMMYTILSCLL